MSEHLASAKPGMAGGADGSPGSNSSSGGGGGGGGRGEATPSYVRKPAECMRRYTKLRGAAKGGAIKAGASKGPWTEEEDAKVVELVKKHGPKRWSQIASELPGESPLSFRLALSLSRRRLLGAGVLYFLTRGRGTRTSPGLDLSAAGFVERKGVDHLANLVRGSRHEPCRRSPGRVLFAVVSTT